MTAYYLSAIAILCLINISLRSLPFWLPKRLIEHPRMAVLSAYLPPAIMLSLVLYCFSGEYQKNEGVYPFLFASAFVVLLHTLKGNVLLSIAGGTLCYCLFKAWA